MFGITQKEHFDRVIMFDNVFFLKIFLHRRGAFYNSVGEKCVAPFIVILELTQVLYKKE